MSKSAFLVDEYIPYLKDFEEEGRIIRNRSELLNQLQRLSESERSLLSKKMQNSFLFLLIMRRRYLWSEFQKYGCYFVWKQYYVAVKQCTSLYSIYSAHRLCMTWTEGWSTCTLDGALETQKDSSAVAGEHLNNTVELIVIE